MSAKTETKGCPDCGNTRLVKMGSHNLKHCTDCNLDIPWFVEEGEEPIFGGPVEKEVKK